VKKLFNIFLLVTMILIINPLSARADKNIVFLKTSQYLLTQNEFKDLSDELGLSLSYNMLGPARSLGLLGFEIGGALSFANINQGADYWKKVTQDHNPPDYLIIPRLVIRKGLPLGIDVGLSYLKVPNTNISLIGGEIKFVFLKDGITTPAIGLRAAYSSLIGVDRLSMQVVDVSLAVSKKFLILEPYAGISEVFIVSKPTNIPLSLSPTVYLKNENLSNTKGTIGLQLNFGIARFALEAAISKIPVYSIKLTFGL